MSLPCTITAVAAAYAIGMENGAPEAIRELEQLRSKRDVQYAAVLALLFFHKRAQAIDR
jgi:hypothetical protein